MGKDEKQIVCAFSDVTEHDMDMLFLEEFACSSDFLKLFTDQIGIGHAEVISVEASKTDIQLGESDMTVVIEVEGQKVGLLIEDKIDAIAMPEQCNRYYLRGKKGIENGDYDFFYVFIVAPKSYLTQNAEAKKYPNRIEYETVLLFFEGLDDRRAQFKAQQIQQAIQKQKAGYQVQVDPQVTEFWHKYSVCQKESYPEVLLVYNGEDKGSNATWMRISTVKDKLYIQHKADRGYVDLTFVGCGDRIAEVEELLLDAVPEYKAEGYSLHRANKAAVIRLTVPALDLHRPFEGQRQEVDEGFKAVEKLSALAKQFSFSAVDKLLKR